METGNFKRSVRLCFWLTLVAALVTAAPSRSQQAAPHQGNISITGVPHAGPGGPGPTEPISGRVRGVDFATHKVVVYVFAGDRWWVQPTAANPLTDIDATGNWETDTHLGSSYAALLVRQSFRPSATIEALPSVQGDVIAVVRVAGVR
jgi:hypothetical protein